MVSLSQDGSTLAVDIADRNPAVVIGRRDGRSVVLNAANGLMYVALHPEGRWVATGNYMRSGVHVWDSGTGKRVADLPAGGTATVAFGPTGSGSSSAPLRGTGFIRSARGSRGTWSNSP